MSITVACQCGQRFLAQPHLAGQLVTCPSCGGWIDVPALADPHANLPSPGVARQAPAAAPQRNVAPSYPATAGGYGKMPLAPSPTERSGSMFWIVVPVAIAIGLLLLIGATAAMGFLGYEIAKGYAKPSSAATPQSAPPAAPSPAAVPAKTDNAGTSSTPLPPGVPSTPPPSSPQPSSPPPSSPPPSSPPSAVPSTPFSPPVGSEKFPPSPPDSPAPKTSTPVIPSESDKPKIPAGWRTYTSRAAEFSIAFPGIKLNQEAPHSPDGPRIVDNLVAGTENSSVAMVLVFDVSSVPIPGFQDQFANNMLDQMINTAGGREVKREDVTIAGHPGKGARYIGKHGTGDGVFQMRAFAVHGWVYQLVFISPVGKGTESDADAFFASFRLTGLRG